MYFFVINKILSWERCWSLSTKKHLFWSTHCSLTKSISYHDIYSNVPRKISFYVNVVKRLSKCLLIKRFSENFGNFQWNYCRKSITQKLNNGTDVVYFQSYNIRRSEKIKLETKVVNLFKINDKNTKAPFIIIRLVYL